MNKEFEEIVFHDLLVDKINFDEFNQNLIIDIFIFDESIENYSTKSIHFQKITMISFDEIVLKQQDNLEIYSFDYNWNNQIFYGKMILLLDFGKPLAVIEFECSNVNYIQ